MSKRHLWVICTGLFASIYAVPVSAQTCKFLVGTMNFGQVNLLPGAPIDGAVNFLVDCDDTTSVMRNCLSINAGSFGDATSRRMGSGANRLRYEFYRDSARTLRWGSYETNYGGGVGRQLDVPADGQLAGTVYVRILPNQQATPPSSTSYADTTSANVVTRYRSGTSQTCPMSGGTTNTNVNQVSATVPPNCLVSAGNMNFGTANLLTSNVDATSTISVQCTNTTPYTVQLSGGGEANAAARKMASGPNRIDYQLYRDAARSQQWGDVSADSVAGTGNAANQSLTVYGRVPPQATPNPGTYTDTIVVTVTY